MIPVLLVVRPPRRVRAVAVPVAARSLRAG